MATEIQSMPATAPEATARFLKYSEMYLSLQGEGRHSGLPCFFLRTAVCDVRCTWCDTPEALSGGEWISRTEILAAIPAHVQLVQITGGEPLIQKDRVIELIEILSAAPYEKKVLLETGGHRSLAGLPESTHIVMDIKLPSSGEDRHDFAANFEFLKRSDEIKFVIADRNDFERAEHWIREYRLEDVCELLISPVWNRLALNDLAQWLLDAKLQARLQTQLHKHTWGGEATGV